MTPGALSASIGHRTGRVGRLVKEGKGNTRAVWDHEGRRVPVPLRRRSAPGEQAYPIIFTNSGAASSITGENLVTDGGTMGAVMTGNIYPAIFAGTQIR